VTHKTSSSGARNGRSMVPAEAIILIAEAAMIVAKTGVRLRAP
jgi:hypothetical protein